MERCNKELFILSKIWRVNAEIKIKDVFPLLLKRIYIIFKG